MLVFCANYFENFAYIEQNFRFGYNYAVIENFRNFYIFLCKKIIIHAYVFPVQNFNKIIKNP